MWKLNLLFLEKKPQPNQTKQKRPHKQKNPQQNKTPKL